MSNFRSIQLGELLFESVVDQVVATGSTQATAFVLPPSEMVRLTTVASGTGVMLPPAQPGLCLLIVNHGANPVQVYGRPGDLINDVTSATGVQQLTNSFVYYSCFTAGLWYTSVKSTASINVLDAGAKGDSTNGVNGTDDTAAIQAAINTGRPVFFPAPPGGFYKITAPLDMRNNIGQHLFGMNSRTTKICQATANTQILRVGGNTLSGGAGQIISGLWLQTASEQSSSNTNAIGIELNQAFGSIFEDLVIYRTVTALGINQSLNPNYAFSNTFDALWINNFSLRALDFRSVVSGSTGNVFLNIYCNNLKDDGVTRGSCTRAIEFAIHASTFLSVINVEDCTPSSDAVMFQQIRGGEINALHFERVNMDQSSTAFLNIVDDQTNLVVNGVDVHFCEIGQGNLGQVGIIGYFGNPRAHITGVNTVSNTNNGTQFYFISSIFGTTGAITITESNVSGTNGEQLVVAANPPVVKRVNLDWRHRTEGGNNILWGTAAPVSGTWAVGDRVYQTAPAAGGFIGFVCTTGGSPGTWKTFGAISP